MLVPKKLALNILENSVEGWRDLNGPIMTSFRDAQASYDSTVFNVSEGKYYIVTHLLDEDDDYLLPDDVYFKPARKTVDTYKNIITYEVIDETIN